MSEAENADAGGQARNLRVRRAVLGGVAVVLLVAALTGGALALAARRGGHRSSVVPHQTPKVTSVPAPTATTVDRGGSLVAEVQGSLIQIFDDPSAPGPSKTLPNPWLLNGDANKPVKQVFLVERVRDDWIQVLLPERPNGSTGWVRAHDVAVTHDPNHIEVSRSGHRITVFNGAQIIYQGPVATGAPATPTPTGTYYIRVLLQTLDPTSVYGPFAYGLSAHSDVLTQFAGGDAEVGIHGNNDASVLGTSVTHGCVRMDNTAITTLSKTLPLGTPVVITG